MKYVLLLTLKMMVPPTGVTLHDVQGFENLETCNYAGKMWADSASLTEVRYFSCVPQNSAGKKAQPNSSHGRSNN
jgi:hypothetical protein